MQACADDPYEADTDTVVAEVLGFSPPTRTSSPPNGWRPCCCPIPAANGCAPTNCCYRAAPLAPGPRRGLAVQLRRPGFVAEYGCGDTAQAGRGVGFLIVTDDMPVAADHDLPDEDLWWDAAGAAADVAGPSATSTSSTPTGGPAALTLLATDGRTAPLLSDRDGYTAWWLHAATPSSAFVATTIEAPDDPRLAGVLDPLDHPHADLLASALGGVIESAADAQLVLDRLADPAWAQAWRSAPMPTSWRPARRVCSPSTTSTCRRGAQNRRVRRRDGVVVDRPWLVRG